MRAIAAIVYWVMPLLRKANPVPSARIDFRVGGSERSTLWKYGDVTPPELGKISFFDAGCAAVHVDKANSLAFIPFGLDVLPKLGTVCQQLKKAIAENIVEQDAAQPFSLSEPKAEEETNIRSLLDSLDEISEIEHFRRLAELSEADRQRIVTLREALGTDPIAKARALRNTATRLGRLGETLQRATDSLSSEALDVLRTNLQSAVSKRAAARAAAEQAFGGQPLSGVGEEVWRELWEAARRYSRQRAYPDHEFPATDNDARCVLCQQALAIDAQRRLSAFEAFVKADLQQSTATAEAKLTRTLDEVERVTLGRSAFNEHLADLDDDQKLARSIRRYFRIAWRIRLAISRSCAAGEWSIPCGLPSSPAPGLDDLTHNLIRRAEELEQAADEVKRQALRREQKELEARAWLGQVLGDVEKEIHRKMRLASLIRAESDAVTTGITNKSGELANKYVTNVLRDKMSNEIKALGAGYLRIAFDPARGQLGEKRFKIALQGVTKDTKVGDILSEGEFRCIALAGFLAELSTESSGSALVFDDPVSSLDHRWRRKVAQRLADEADRRQVIIFTHEIGFLADLVDFYQRKGRTPHHCYLQRGVQHAGECLDGLPWPAMKVNDRIGVLKKCHQDAATKYRKEGEAAYEPEGRRIYGLLRETWERCVEEVLLNGAVIRFERAIQTQRLRHLADVTQNDLQTIEAGMTKCSRFLDGHDEPGAVMDPVPGPDELLADIGSLDEWSKQVRKRRG